MKISKYERVRLFAEFLLHVIVVSPSARWEGLIHHRDGPLLSGSESAQSHFEAR